MVRSSSAAFLTIVGLLATALTPAEVRAHGRDPPAREAAKNGWRTNLRAAKEEAKKSGKPLMVVLRCFD
jgi:hypothetical protein